MTVVAVRGRLGMQVEPAFRTNRFSEAIEQRHGKTGRTSVVDSRHRQEYVQFTVW